MEWSYLNLQLIILAYFAAKKSWVLDWRRCFCDWSISSHSIWSVMPSVANLVVFPWIWACFFVELRVFLKTCGLVVFRLVLTEICWFFADFCFSDCFFFNFYGNFLIQFVPKGILGVFFWKFDHFGLVFFRICYHAFLFNLLADFSFCCIVLPTHVGLVLQSNYLFLACFSYFLACFCKITWHHW